MERWGRLNNFTVAPRLQSRGDVASCALNTPAGVLLVKAASRLAYWDGMQLQLGFAPRETNGQVFVHALDVRKNFQPLLEKFSAVKKIGRVIVIDPGHGGKNLGTKSILGERYEKEFTLDWAKRLAPLLVTNGWTVFLTRTGDDEVELSNRVAFAESRRADLFISLHFNSPKTRSANPQEAGLETYCLTPTGMPSNITSTSEDDLSLKFLNNAFDAQNLQYAALLHRALLRVNDRKDRGLRHARFMGVLRGQNRPAVLIEGGYLSNPAEAKLIETPEYRQKLAEAIAAALK